MTKASPAPKKDSALFSAMSHAIRVLAATAVEKANSGHPGLPMGMADVVTVLFDRHIITDPAAPRWPDRDRFVLSAGHGSMLLYALHYLLGNPAMPLAQIKNFRQFGSHTPGHPEHDTNLGIETTTGPLGQGFANAVGMALAERSMNARFGDGLVKHHTYVLVSDGDLMEGISYEAAALAGHLQLKKLIVLYDDNDISIDGSTKLADSSDVVARFTSCGWNVVQVDGHNHDAIDTALTKARKAAKPTLLAFRTIIGYGAKTVQGTAKAHGAPLGKDALAALREDLQFPKEDFAVEEKILTQWRRVGGQHTQLRKAWEQRHQSAQAEKRNAFDCAVDGGLPTNLPELTAQMKDSFRNSATNMATRNTMGAVLERFVPAMPNLIGGSADLSASTCTKTSKQKIINASDYAGQFIHYGVREHAMAGIMNGMALHGGVIPYGGTFFIFSDYCRPSLRLAAMMQQRVIYIMTHDSIGVGEDGPTHQPVEHLTALRAIPGLRVMRPCDGVETAECWQLALNATRHPTVFALTRQKLPLLRTQKTAANLCERGGYLLCGAKQQAKVTLFATGSEVHLAVTAQEILTREGIATRVVSMPCMELFHAQPLSYRQEIIEEESHRIVVEAGLRMSWDWALRPQDTFIGMDGFGASAPQEQLYESFNITVDSILRAARGAAS